MTISNDAEVEQVLRHWSWKINEEMEGLELTEIQRVQVLQKLAKAMQELAWMRIEALKQTHG